MLALGVSIKEVLTQKACANSDFCIHMFLQEALFLESVFEEIPNRKQTVVCPRQPLALSN